MITTNVDKIRAQIKLHGKTQTEVAKALGFLSTNLTRTINNSRITLADLNKLAEATGCNVVDFFMDNDRESGGQVFDWKLQSNTYPSMIPTTSYPLATMTLSFNSTAGMLASLSL